MEMPLYFRLSCHTAEYAGLRQLHPKQRGPSMTAIVPSTPTSSDMKLNILLYDDTRGSSYSCPMKIPKVKLTHT